jgi:hypothetical protein
MNNGLFLENFKISIFKKKNITYIYLYNEIYYCLLKFSKKIELNLQSNKLISLKQNKNTSKINLKLNFFLKQFYFYKFVKIKFTGKGYKIKKNTNKSMILLFNRAHTTTLWWKNIIIKKLKKYKMYIKYNNKYENLISTILNTRYINIFTKKGLRKSRQILLKKKGKK